MKLINRISIALLLPLLVFNSCKKETTDNVSRAVKVSYPEITLNGDDLVIVAVGANYTDAGAKLRDDITGAITDIQPTSGNVNTAQPGLYIVRFSASNSNGFETAATRLVAVTSVNNPIDRTGTYLRTATGINCFITKIANGVYKLQNPPGASVSPNAILYMVETATNVYVAPAQPAQFSNTFGDMAVVNINFTATGVTWNILADGFGTGTRTFIKQ